MTAIRLGPGDFLEFNPKYGVLICHQCRYAIQKTALASHLLRHKIYRGDRQQLLSAIAKLNILEPSQVPLPSSGCPPVDALPVLTGYRCTVEGCGNLCASSKRMDHHWSEMHSMLATASSFSSRACSVRLQTFFRGTKIRYFEVSSSPPSAPSSGADLAGDSEEGGRSVINGTEASETQGSVNSASLVSTDLPKGNSGLLEIDLQTLAYFNHFTTETISTLPPDTRRCPETDWRHEFVAHALQQEWLMYGLLAISASHMCSLEEDTGMKANHQESFKQLHSMFSVMWTELTCVDLEVAPQTGIMEAGWRVSCILQCFCWTLVEPRVWGVHGTDPTPPDEMECGLTVIRNFLATKFLSGHDNSPTRSDAISTGERSSSTSPPGNTPPSTVLSQLRAIPFRLAVLCDKPQSLRDGNTTLTAAAILDDCCHDSFASDGIDVPWHGMMSWLAQVPDQFNTLISKHNPAALLILAYWVAVLVRRAEQCGCWILKGAARKLLALIADGLPPDASKVRSLVKDLNT
ncbi:hypothetical protein DL98DRAFT_505423 [Cadophora sp. DSE1049]|nr:hypothetical protein DL98DRAFT_505423 [Cadophora sp. DSE1049]